MTITLSDGALTLRELIDALEECSENGKNDHMPVYTDECLPVRNAWIKSNRYIELGL